MSKIRFYDFINKSYKELEEKNTVLMHLSSRSLILQITNDKSQPMYKYLLKYFKDDMSIDVDTGLLTIQLSKIVEIPVNSVVPKPYIIHQGLHQ